MLQIKNRRVTQLDASGMLELPSLGHQFARPVDHVTPLGQALGLTPDELHVRRVCTGHYTVNLAVNTLAAGHTLFVMLHGARADANSGAALFRRITWSDALQGPVLAISDPVSEPLWSTPMPRSSMYAGSLSHDLVPELNALIDQVASELGIADDRIVFNGMSAGGASVMLVACRRRTARIIAANPVCNPSQFPRWILDAWLAHTGHSRDELQALQIREPWRVDGLAAFNHGLAQGQDLRLFIAHNLADRATTQRHYPAIRQALGVTDELGGYGADGRALVTVYRQPSHMQEPFSVLLGAALAWFDSPADGSAGTALPGLKTGSFELEDEPGDESPPTSAPEAQPQAGPERLALPALAEPAQRGHLFLTGAPGTDVVRLAHVLCAVRPICLGNERYGRRLRETGQLTPSLFDSEARLMTAQEGDQEVGRDAPQREQLVDRAHDYAWSAVRWRGDKLNGLWRHYAATLRHFPDGRIVFVNRNPMDAVAAGLARQGPAASSEALLLSLVEEWNRSQQTTLEALQAHGERILVIDAEDLWSGIEAVEPVFHWLGTVLRPAVQRRYDKALAGVLEADAQTPGVLSARQRRLICQHADILAWRRVCSR